MNPIKKTLIVVTVLTLCVSPLVFAADAPTLDADQFKAPTSSQTNKDTQPTEPTKYPAGITGLQSVAAQNAFNAAPNMVSPTAVAGCPGVPVGPGNSCTRWFCPKGYSCGWPRMKEQRDEDVPESALQCSKSEALYADGLRGYCVFEINREKNGTISATFATAKTERAS